MPGGGGWEAIAALLVLGLAAGACTDDGTDSGSATTTAPPATTTTAQPAPETVATTDIVLAYSMSSTLIRHEDEVLILDGLATDDDLRPYEEGADPRMRAYVISGGDPDTAMAYDLPSVGPRVFPDAWWWDDRWAFVANRCPEPWDDREIDADYEAGGEPEQDDCGSRLRDLFTFDPTTGEVAKLAADFTESLPEGDRWSVEHVATNERSSLFAAGDDQGLVSIDLAGTVTDVPDLETERAAFTLPAADGYVALVRTGEFGGTGEPMPMTEYFTLHRLQDDGWEEEPLPPSDAAFGGLGNTMVGDGYLVVNGVTFGADPIGLPLLRVDPDDGSVSWEVLPPAPFDPDVTLSVQYELRDGSITAPDGARWDGSAWVPTAPGPARDQYNYAGVRVTGDTAWLQLVETTNWWDPVTVTLTLD